MESIILFDNLRKTVAALDGVSTFQGTWMERVYQKERDSNLCDLHKIHCAAKKMQGIHETRHMLGREPPETPKANARRFNQCKSVNP